MSKSPAAAPLLLEVKQHYYSGVTAGQSLSWPLTVSGGQAPYHLTWDWGDGTAPTKSTLGTAGQLSPSHTYTAAGAYRITVRVVDSAGQEAAMSLVAIVTGGPAAAVTTHGPTDGSVLMAWPLLAGAGLVVVSFWLGERHLLALARRRPLGSYPQLTT